MDDFPPVHIFKGQANLYKPLENLFLSKLLIVLLLLLDVVGEITDRAVLHHDDQVVLT